MYYTNMGVMIKKQEKMPTVLGSVGNVSRSDRLDIIKERYKHAKSVTPNYGELYTELEGYAVSMPETVDFPDISLINKLYAIAQSYLSRITEIEISAINNNTRWKRILNRIKSFISDEESKLLITEEVKNLPNSATQKAFVRNKLSKLYEKFDTIQEYLEEADSFERSVVVKKKDLQSFLMNLTRQVKALGVEKSMTL